MLRSTCPYNIRSWSRQYQPGDLFDAAGHFGVWQAYALLRWIGSDGAFYCDLFCDDTAWERKTGTGIFTRLEIETGFDLCGGPTCRAEQEA